MGLKRIDISGTSMPYDKATSLNQHNAAVGYVTNTIKPALESINGISYVGAYHTEDTPDETKFMFEFGYANYYLAIRVKSSGVYFAICKKTDFNNLNNFVYNGDSIKNAQKHITIDGVTNYYLVFTGSIDYMMNELNDTLLVLYDPATINGMTYTFDEDNYGNKFMFYGTGGTGMRVTYDNELYLNDSISYTAITNEIEDTVYVENVALSQSNKLMGVSNHLRRIQSNAISASTSRQTLIDVDGIRYRQLRGIYWVIES